MNEECTIESIGCFGEGIGVWNGLKVFIPGALPGETVFFEMVERKKTYAKGRLLKISTPSEERILPKCPLFGTCGGCQLMHLDQFSQLAIKTKLVKDALERIGGFVNPLVSSCLPSPKFFNYRNKIQLPIKQIGNQCFPGLYRAGSHEIVPIKSCFIQDALGEKILNKLCPLLSNQPSVRTLYIRTSSFFQTALITLVTNGTQPHLKKLAMQIQDEIPEVIGVVENINLRSDNIVFGSDYRLLSGQFHLFEKLEGKTFQISAPSFFQVNPLQAAELYRFAIKVANIERDSIVLDAFCGVGTLSLFAADIAEKVYGIECVTHAIEDANENKKINNCSSCHFLCAIAEKAASKLPKADIVFLNPPRKGCAPSLLEFLGKCLPNTIIYISCDPATLARDLKLLSFYNYQIDLIQPFDMFPQTSHVETVVKLTVKSVKNS